MKICGIGLVCAHGRGLPALEAALASGPLPPTWLPVPFQPDPFPVYAVAPEVLKDQVALAGMRRADRFSKMATLAACDAVAESGARLDNPERVGVIFATAFGPHTTTFNFLDEILDYGDGGVSPTIFSHSVHNAAVSYISHALAIKGPTWTVARFHDPFRQALTLADAWLAEGRCERVLLGAGDECGPVLEYVCAQKLALADSETRLRPFWHPRGPRVIPGELAVFFLLANDSSPGLRIAARQAAAPPPDVLLTTFESRTLDARAASLPTGCWSHVAGASPVSSALNCAVASLMLRRQSVFPATNLLLGQADVRPPETPPPLRCIECQTGFEIATTLGVRR